MEELIVYYSYSGKAKALAQRLAKEKGASLCEVQFEKKPSMLQAFFLCPSSIRQKKAKIKPIEANFANYQKITIIGPIWAGLPAPPINNAIAALPKGKSVDVIMLSASGKSGREKVQGLIQRQGCTVASYQDMASAK